MSAFRIESLLYSGNDDERGKMNEGNNDDKGGEVSEDEEDEASETSDSSLLDEPGPSNQIYSNPYSTSLFSGGFGSMLGAFPKPLSAGPTLTELQMIFGIGGPKPQYKRARKSAVERKPRQAYSSRQLDMLEAEFKKDKYLSVSKRMDLSKLLALTETQIKTWFQNRRTKWKKQMTANMRLMYRQNIFASPFGQAYQSIPRHFTHPSMLSNYATDQAQDFMNNGINHEP